MRTTRALRGADAVTSRISKPIVKAPPPLSLKRARSPCKYELQYKELDQQRAQLESSLARKASELVSLERGILDFYHTRSICFKDLAAASGGVDARGSQLIVNAEENRSSAGTGSARVNAYVQNSEISQARQQLQQLLTRQAAEIAVIVGKLEKMELDVDTRVIKGSLAAAQKGVEVEEKALKELEAAVEEQNALAEQHKRELEKENRALEAIEQNKHACQERMRVLEKKKRRQMENVGNTRVELQQLKGATDGALAEVKRREAVIDGLRHEIERRRNFLKKRNRLT